MSEIKEVVGRCHACGVENAVISYNFGRDPVCTHCHTRIDKEIAEREWIPTEKELDEWHDEYYAVKKAEKAEVERMERKFTTWKEKQTKKFEIFKDGLRPIF